MPKQDNSTVDVSKSGLILKVTLKNSCKWRKYWMLFQGLMEYVNYSYKSSSDRISLYLYGLNFPNRTFETSSGERTISKRIIPCVEESMHPPYISVDTVRIRCMVNERLQSYLFNFFTKKVRCFHGNILGCKILDYEAMLMNCTANNYLWKTTTDSCSFSTKKHA